MNTLHQSSALVLSGDPASQQSPSGSQLGSGSQSMCREANPFGSRETHTRLQDFNFNSPFDFPNPPNKRVHDVRSQVLVGQKAPVRTTKFTPYVPSTQKEWHQQVTNNLRQQQLHFPQNVMNGTTNFETSGAGCDSDSESVGDSNLDLTTEHLPPLLSLIRADTLSNDEEAMENAYMGSHQISGVFSFPPPEFPTKPKEWHLYATTEMRIHCTRKLYSIFPCSNSSVMTELKKLDLINCARKTEKKIFEKADDREQYLYLLSEKMSKIRKKMSKRSNRKEKHTLNQEQFQQLPEKEDEDYKKMFIESLTQSQKLQENEEHRLQQHHPQMMEETTEKQLQQLQQQLQQLQQQQQEEELLHRKKEEEQQEILETLLKKQVDQQTQIQQLLQLQKNQELGLEEQQQEQHAKLHELMEEVYKPEQEQHKNELLQKQNELANHVELQLQKNYQSQQHDMEKLEERHQQQNHHVLQQQNKLEEQQEEIERQLRIQLEAEKQQQQQNQRQALKQEEQLVNHVEHKLQELQQFQQNNMEKLEERQQQQNNDVLQQQNKLKEQLEEIERQLQTQMEAEKQRQQQNQRQALKQEEELPNHVEFLFQQFQEHHMEKLEECQQKQNHELLQQQNKQKEQLEEIERQLKTKMEAEKQQQPQNHQQATNQEDHRLEQKNGNAKDQNRPVSEPNVLFNLHPAVRLIIIMFFIAKLLSIFRNY